MSDADKSRQALFLSLLIFLMIVAIAFSNYMKHKNEAAKRYMTHEHKQRRKEAKKLRTRSSLKNYGSIQGKSDSSVSSKKKVARSRSHSQNAKPSAPLRGFHVPEIGVIMIVGMLAGYLVDAFPNDDFVEDRLKLQPKYLLTILLPPILFYAGT